MNNYDTIIFFIYFSNNNILFSVTTLKGKTLTFLSTGSKKSRGIRKINLSSLKSIILFIMQKFKRANFHIKTKGITKFKRVTLKLLFKTNSNKILSVCDLTSQPHNGVRSPKIRRI